MPFIRLVRPVRKVEGQDCSGALHPGRGSSLFEYPHSDAACLFGVLGWRAGVELSGIRAALPDADLPGWQRDPSYRHVPDHYNRRPNDYRGNNYHQHLFHYDDHHDPSVSSSGSVYGESALSPRPGWGMFRSPPGADLRRVLRAFGTYPCVGGGDALQP